jgi:hypothetical protein
LNYYSAFSDLIVKYHKIEDSIKAFDNLNQRYGVQYVPTKHNSDEANNFHYVKTETYDHDARDATLTLNMFKISKDNNVFVPADQFFSMIPSVHQHNEVENLYADNNCVLK